ncbi:hypothetical protein C8R44DRAFT_883320 [Mycena epipterygia]|nr:hypothetical protein C8R44DRAFT_883320 [Mycena epipterygia]
MLLAPAIGRDSFLGPPPLIDMAVPFEVALGVLTGVEMLVVVVIARLSPYPHLVAPESSGRIALRTSSSTRRLFSVSSMCGSHSTRRTMLLYLYHDLPTTTGPHQDSPSWVSSERAGGRVELPYLSPKSAWTSF